MKKRLIIITILSTFMLNITLSQEGKVKEAQKQYQDLSYIKSIETLQTLMDAGNENPNLLEKLANAYYFNGKMKAASEVYAKLLEQTDSITSETYFRYYQSLKSQEAYQEADKIMQRFKKENPNDSRAQRTTGSENYLSVIRKLSDDFEIKNLDINTENSDFGVSFVEGGIYFASAQGEGKMYKWNGQPFLDIYEQKGDQVAERIQGLVNTKYHESSTAITKDGQTLYFTRNNYYAGKFKKNSKNEHSLKIYKATLEDGKWNNIESLPFNNDEYSVAHPALNSDETKLYFASDMPGTMGGSDIFVVSIYEDGSFGTPKNLGSKINTEGRENFPYVSSNGTLYFSSDAHEGLGGLDVFEIANIDDLELRNETVYNVGRPINSPKDDFGYIINENTLEGYFASNRKGGQGDDDIYSFKRNPLQQVISGLVKDANDQMPIANAQVLIYDEANNLLNTLETDAEGRFITELNYKQQQYTVDVIKPDYKESKETFVVNGKLKREIYLEIPLETVKPIIPEGTDLTQYLSLNPVYFDFDQWNIRPDAAKEIEKVIALLKEYPDLKIDVRSHTDSRASAPYNEALSQRRNKSTITYIIEKGGISPDRLTGTGYGERELINKCDGTIICTEAEHQENRRSEFIVVLN